jgi:hypothetical protein
MLNASNEFKSLIYENGRYTQFKINFTLDGVTTTYYDERIVSVDVLEECSVINDTSTTNEAVIVLDNQDNTFNFLRNDQFETIIEKKPKLELYCGIQLSDLTTEWIPLGVYFLHEWENDTTVMTINLICRDYFENLANDSIKNANVTDTLSDLAATILTNSGITNYSLDSSLNNYSGSFPSVIDSRTALQQIAQATMCTLYQDRYGKINIKPVSKFHMVSTYPGSTTFPVVYTLVNNSFQMRNVTQDYMYTYPTLKIQRKVKEIAFNLSSTTFVVQNGTVTTGDSFSIENPFITTQAHALEVAEWIFDNTKHTGYYETDWKQNPLLECLDTVIIDDYSGKPRQSIITRQEFNYAGFLKGRTTAKGGV